MEYLNEIATLSRPEDKIPHNTEIIVCEEKEEGIAKTPHFHVLLNNGEREFEIAFEHTKQM